MAMLPKINIRSVTELSRRLSDKSLPRQRALALIRDVLANQSRLWKDSKASDASKRKFVRNAKRTKLGNLLHLIDHKVLAAHDKELPGFIFGGVTSKSHLDAAFALMGNSRKRTLLALDISTFFENVDAVSVTNFFCKAGCSLRLAEQLSNLCCVPEGPKDNPSPFRTLARGFATSTRLATWVNIRTFKKLELLVRNRLRRFDPRIAIFVDDIGITASNVPKAKMVSLGLEIQKLLATFDNNQPLPLNAKKSKVLTWEEGMEHLGVRLGKGGLSPGRKSQIKYAKLLNEIGKTNNNFQRRKLLQKKKGHTRYRRFIRQSNADRNASA